MTLQEIAKKHNLTIEKLQAERYEFLQSEGYDSNGNEHETLESWLTRGYIKIRKEPIHKGDFEEQDYSSLFN